MQKADPEPQDESFLVIMQSLWLCYLQCWTMYDFYWQTITQNNGSNNRRTYTNSVLRQ